MSPLQEVLILAYIYNRVYCQTYFYEKLKKINYDKEEKPLPGKNNVTVQIYIYSAGPIDESKFTVSAGFYMREWWYDHRLRSENENTIKTVSLDDYIWLPHTSVADASTEKRYHKSMRTEIKPNGRVYTSRRVETVSKCAMDLKNYPMDKQKCEIVLETYAFSTSAIELFWHQLPVLQSEMLDLDGYDLENIKSLVKETSWKIGNESEVFKTLKIQFVVQRTFLYHIYRTYIPSMLLLIFAFGSFWIPKSAIPARIGVLVTSFMASTFILQGVSENTVKVSYTTPMQMFLVVQISFIVVSMLVYTLILRADELDRKARKSLSASNNSTVVLKNTLENGEVYKNVSSSSNEEQGHLQPHKLDRAARYVLPILYFAFCIWHFAYYVR